MGTQDKSREHQANERTFLAWVRTSIGIMAFGFVVVKFSLFLKQLAFILQKEVPTPQKSFSSLLGIFLVAFGLVMALLAFVRYRQVEKQLRSESYFPSTWLPMLLISVIMVIGIFVMIYLVRSVG